MKYGLPRGVLIALVFTLCCASSQAQYLSSDEAKNQKEQQARQERDREANSYVGKTFWYVPNPNAMNRVEFFSEIPQSILDNGRVQFFPTETTSFSVTEVETKRSASYASLDEYFLKIQFPDEKVGYITPDEIRRNLDDGNNYDFEEYIFPNDPRTKVADHAGQKKPSVGGKTSGIAQKSGPRIGMTKEQALASSWGRPNKINKTSTAPGAREQWVYGSKYLYFEKGVLVAIDK
jgi:hypothetical protein